MLRPISLSIPSACLYVSRLGLHGLMACVTVTDRHNAVIRTMLCSFTCARVCLLGVSLTLLPILRVKSPENPNFWGVNRCFQAKQAKYWKFHVIETNASISTKFCTTIETNKNSSWVVPIGGRPTNPRWRTAAILKKPLNRFISATVWPILIRFGTMTHIGLLQRTYR